MRVKATVFEGTEAARGTPGAVVFAQDLSGLWYVCPCGCDSLSFLYFRVAGGKTPSWRWDGDRQRPTLEPSIHHRIGKAGVKKHDPGNPDHWDTHWHGHLRRGTFESA